MKTRCPKCQHEFDTSNIYDPSDPIQLRGYNDQNWNENEGSFGSYRANEYPANSDEYYRWNRGARARMGR